MEAIRCESLSKKYRLRHLSDTRYETLRDVLASPVRSMKAWLPRIGSSERHNNVDDFWALQDVSLRIIEGERLGLIGRNGAGKSTLLKILARITHPTSGRALIRGRVASLLEVGTGFHPELTGRENIFLNGAILGMARQEIRRKFDEIVAFADVEQFLDTPVKRYSSGMRVRLAFSVAAHLETEILIVDEVLAVGDAQFQKKCLGRMEEVGRTGRTVLFVSHNMGAMTSLCTRCVLLQKGRIGFDGSPSEAILRYFQDDDSSPAKIDYRNAVLPIGDHFCRLLSAAVLDTDGAYASEVRMDESVRVAIEFEIRQAFNGTAVPNFHFYSGDGSCAFVSIAAGAPRGEPGIYIAQCTIPARLLNEGPYFVGIAVTSYFANGYQVNFFERNALSFNMRDPHDEASGRYGYGYAGAIPGAVRPTLNWTVEKVGP